MTSRASLIPLGIAIPALMVAFTSTWTLPASGQAQATSVWYRSTEACPDGQQFLSKLAARSVAARLADAGDPVDFVVTLGPNADGFGGRLERQTQGGTIAIRTLDDPSCDGVAKFAELPFRLITDAGVAHPLIDVRLRNAVLAAELVQEDTGWALREGTIAGEIPVQELLAQVGRFDELSNSRPVCTDTATYGLVRAAICDQVDLPVTTSRDCDALSFGMAFAASPAIIAGILQRLDDPSQCVPENEPANDACDRPLR